MLIAGVPIEIVAVFAVILVALVLFVSEVIPNDVTAIGVIAALASMQPIFGIDVGLDSREAIIGFANPATITIVGMYMLSAGIQNTGLVQRLGVYLARFTKGSERRALAATVCTTGPIAGFINNTPVVAVFLPMISDLAEKTGISPSKLLLPLSYAAILGGTLTLIGTATNILASDFARMLLDRPQGIGMFEFTALGVVIMAVGIAYLLTIGARLTPSRIPVGVDMVEEFDVEDQLAQFSVREDSPLIGRNPADAEDLEDGSVTVLQLRRGDDAFVVPETDRVVEAGDQLVVHGTVQALNRLRERQGLRHLVQTEITDATFEDAPTDRTLAKAVVPEDSPFAGETIAETRLEEFHRTTVLAVRREGELYRADLDDFELRRGDTLLVRLPEDAIEYFTDSLDLILADERAFDRLAETDVESFAPLSPKTTLTVGIMAWVVFVAAIGALPIVIAALAGVFAMLVTGCLTTSDAYDAVSWNVIFLLAGVIPLGIAMERTGGAALLAEVLVATEAFLPLFAVLLLFYVVTGLFANVITPVATVVLMLPVAVDAAAQLGANQFAFLLAVMFASATSLSTPVGYQTNLMVYGPGGYRFMDFVRVGGPLQLLLAVVTTAGIAYLWGLTP